MVKISTAILSLVPKAVFAITDNQYDTIEWSDSRAQPTKSQVDTEIARLEAQIPLDQCKDEAKKRIAATDWAVLPDVGLANVTAFETYRATLRELIKNPVAEPTWPTEPEPIWS